MIKRLLTTDRLRNTFLFAVALVVAWIRNVLQYHQYSFDSIWMLLGFWIVHYFAIAIGAAIYYGLLQALRRRFLDSDESERKVSAEDALVQFFLASLLIAAAVFVLAHWPQSLSEE